jgi:hypothetical protein
MTEKAPIPNILIIEIKTRIPDHFTIQYKPSMTLPKEEGKYIYFDPLVIYNPNAVMTEEFFDKNKFETMMNRILSRFSGMQPKRISLEQGIIENNIKITLNSLFGAGKLFYIENHPYTIIDHKWDGKWTTETNYDVQNGGENVNVYVYPDKKYVYKFKKKSGIKITVELELFSGKNPSSLALSNLLCERKMENIRKSYADLFGYEYRPAPTKYAKGRRRQASKRGGKKRKKGTKKHNKKVF